MLVPEIALTPQTVARFQARFGDTVALLHSALGEGERYDEWRRLRTGEARIAVGPRSAVFAPVADLGLVVVDEEHDASFKHEGDPRYDARTVAAERARRTGATLLVGTATPRPETWHALPHLRLPDRVDSPPAAARARARHARARAHPLHPRDAPRARRRAQVDRAAQPPRLVELPHLPVVRQDLGVPAAATSRSSCTAPSTRSRATTAATANASPIAATPAARSPSPATAPAPSASSTSSREALDVPIFRLDADTAGAKDAVPELLARFRAAPAGRAARHADGRQGPRLPGRRRSASCSTPTHAALPRLPRRGAHVRADRPARGPRRARRRAAAACSCRRRAGRAARSRPPPATTRDGFLAGELERRRALRYPPFADLIRVVCSRRRRRAGARRRGPCAAALDGAAARPRCSAPRRCSACAGASASRSCSRRRARGRDRRDGRGGRRGAARASRGRVRCDVDPHSAVPASTRSARPRPGRVADGLPGTRAATTATMAQPNDPTVAHAEVEPRERRRASSIPRRARAATRRCSYVRKYGDPVLRSRALRSSASTTRSPTRSRGWAS